VKPYVNKLSGRYFFMPCWQNWNSDDGQHSLWLLKPAMGRTRILPSLVWRDKRRWRPLQVIKMQIRQTV